MKTLNVKRLALALGSTGALLHLGCILIMLVAGREGTIKFFNSLLHGLDTASIIRMSIPWWESLLGLLGTFIIAGLAGALIAVVYNISFANSIKASNDNNA